MVVKLQSSLMDSNDKKMNNKGISSGNWDNLDVNMYSLLVKF